VATGISADWFICGASEERFMKNIKLALLALLLLLTGLWLLADTLLPEPFTYFSFRTNFVQFTGILGIGAMSVAMMLATRPRQPERLLGGLDKMYRLHKWLGITALVATTIHWWWAKGTRWMVGWGWLTRPRRGPRGAETLGPIEGWLRAHRGLAESVGEWAFYAAVILIVLALLRRFPYSWFTKTHTWIAAAYLALVFHAIVLVKADYWRQPIGWLLAMLLLGGSIAALLVLTGRVAHGRKVQGTIQSITHYPALRVVETSIQMEQGWPGHNPGQFAFVRSTPGEGAHPYTIASAWNAQTRRIVFIVKSLGDHTGTLLERLKVGMPVSIEGPYGCFDFRGAHTRQVWVGAGIGITPFIARLEYLEHHPDPQTVDLFHTTADFDQAAINKLREAAQAANVRLHVLVDARDGRLSAESIRAQVPDWRAASLWFCGPAAFGTALRENFIDKGLAAADFHQELFQLR
jgi:predicted ferric reductase